MKNANNSKANNSEANNSKANNSKANSSEALHAAQEAAIAQLNEQLAAMQTQLDAAQQQVIASASNALRTAQPGIISYIMQALLNARDAQQPVSSNEILAQLVTRFPERAASGMKVTVRAQLSRIPREKNFDIVRTQSGNVHLYAAAASAKLA